MGGAYTLAGVEVGNSAGKLQDAVVGACRHVELHHSLLEYSGYLRLKDTAARYQASAGLMAGEVLYYCAGL